VHSIVLQQIYASNSRAAPAYTASFFLSSRPVGWLVGPMTQQATHSDRVRILGNIWGKKKIFLLLQVGPCITQHQQVVVGKK
jgi:hypothetical protein